MRVSPSVGVWGGVGWGDVREACDVVLPVPQAPGERLDRDLGHLESEHSTLCGARGEASAGTSVSAKREQHTAWRKRAHLCVGAQARLVQQIEGGQQAWQRERVQLAHNCDLEGPGKIGLRSCGPQQLGDARARDGRRAGPCREAAGELRGQLRLAGCAQDAHPPARRQLCPSSAARAARLRSTDDGHRVRSNQCAQNFIVLGAAVGAVDSDVFDPALGDVRVHGRDRVENVQGRVQRFRVG